MINREVDRMWKEIHAGDHVRVLYGGRWLKARIKSITVKVTSMRFRTIESHCVRLMITPEKGALWNYTARSYYRYFENIRLIHH